MLKKADYRSVLSKLKVLYCLNVTDYMFTIFLVGTGYFEEANIFMVSFVENPLKGLVLKVLVIGLVIVFLAYLFQFAKEKEIVNINHIVNISLCLYIMINVVHVIYTMIYFIGFR